MYFAFRTDASFQIGAGHVMRCISLADEIKHRGGVCTFYSRELPGNLIFLIERRGHKVVPLQKPDSAIKRSSPKSGYASWLGVNYDKDVKDTLTAIGKTKYDWLIVDHYSLDNLWELEMLTAYKKLMVIDDLANRRHFCDVLLDQNLGRSSMDYINLVSQNTKFLIGPKFALLRTEFALLREKSLNRRVHPQFKTLLISLGGVDMDNITCTLLRALNASNELPLDLEITVIMGPNAPWVKDVKEQADKMRYVVEVVVDCQDMAHKMLISDISIGAAGSTSWERCALGLPSILLCLADNQKAVIKELSKSGCAIELDFSSYDDDEIRRRLDIALLLISQNLISMSKLASQIADGNGCKRVVNLMLENI